MVLILYYDTKENPLCQTERVTAAQHKNLFRKERINNNHHLTTSITLIPDKSGERNWSLIVHGSKEAAERRCTDDAGSS